MENKQDKVVEAEPVDLEPVAEEKPVEKTIVAASYSEEYSGLIPHPHHLKQYGEIDPSIPDRLVKMAEQEQAHRHKYTEDALLASTRIRSRAFDERRRGQYCGLAIGIVALVCGTAAAVLGQPWVGGLFGTGGVGSLVYAFLAQKDREDLVELSEE